jgi:hypothetical protein
MTVQVKGVASPPDAANMISVLAGKKEKFLRVTRFALLDRLTRPEAWANGGGAECRRFFKYLEFWRQQSYIARLGAIEQDYEPFSPDSDLLVTRKYSPSERAVMQRRVVEGVQKLLEQANYTRLDPHNLDIIMKASSHYGLELQCDMSVFDELLIYYRGQTSVTGERRSKKKLYMSKEQFEIPTFRRLVVLFKLKPFDVRVREIMASERLDRGPAEKLVAKRRGMLGSAISDDFIYMKKFKNIPQSDLEMVFPNTQIKFRMFDKVKLGATGGAGLGAGVFGAAGKIALLSTNPVAAAGAAIGLGGVAFRQAKNVMNQKNQYMITMAQNLYSHSLADNRGVLALLADRAAEEDVKEEMLLYALLAKERVHVNEIDQVDEAIESYLQNTFGTAANFDVADALARLIADGIVSQGADGYLVTLPPTAAAKRIDELWDGYLDHRIAPEQTEGEEFDDSEEVDASAPLG